jgi:hypothetical protein
MLLALRYLMRGLGAHHFFYCISVAAIIGQGLGAYVSARPWTLLFLVMLASRFMPADVSPRAPSGGPPLGASSL